jgi:hypothetical protein
LVAGDTVLVDNPFEDAAVAEFVVEDFADDAFEGEKVVVEKRAAVFGKFYGFNAVTDTLAPP